MVHNFNTRSILALNAPGVATSATTTAAVDTQGFRNVRLAVYQSISNAPASLKVEGSDDATNYSSINLTSGTDFTAATNNSNATSNPSYVFDIVTARAKRYLRVSITTGGSATANVAVHATLAQNALGLANSATGVTANSGYLSLPNP